MGALVRTQYCPPNEKRPLTCGDAEQGPIRSRARVRCMCQSRSEGTSMNSAKQLWGGCPLRHLVQRLASPPGPCRRPSAGGRHPAPDTARAGADRVPVGVEAERAGLNDDSKAAEV